MNNGFKIIYFINRLLDELEEEQTQRAFNRMHFSARTTYYVLIKTLKKLRQFL